jgi:methylmalonyl-CoA mutase
VRPAIPLSRAPYEEKMSQITNLRRFQERNRDEAERSLRELRDAAVSGRNIFAQLMDTARYASMGQMTKVLYGAGGRYRRNM